ncbi:MAG: methionine--tRNA ligase [Gammaproteobacteria bacterium]
MKTSKRKILVTTGLPYANGDIHLGHALGYIQADIWVRFQRTQGHDVAFVCGDDCHGTPIMINAEKAGIEPEIFIAKTHKEHYQDLNDFYIHYDNFYTTHSEENKTLVEQIFKSLENNGDIEIKSVSQFFDPVKEMFLPDRYVKGECPRCGAQDQYGDNCEACGATYSPTELKNPVSVMSGATPIEKASEHLFFKLQNYEAFLKTWTTGDHLQKQVSNKLQEWFEDGLKNWDISRDAPYFGFEIPGYPNKYFYVWLDAPVGYMASFKNLCKCRDDLNFDDYWKENKKTELIHFIGKDIVYFHALFWPAMLKGAGFRAPSEIVVNGFLTIDGKKMSKSRGTFINARDFKSQINPEFLRYYFAAKLSRNLEDIDLNFEEFQQKINSDLVGKYINIASRTAGFIVKHFDGMLAEQCKESELYQQFISEAEKIRTAYDQYEFSTAMRLIMALADQANSYIAEKAPWSMIKTPGNEKEVQEVCTIALNCFRCLTIFLEPVLPVVAEGVKDFLNIDTLDWDSIPSMLLNHKINKYKPLIQRVDAAQIAALTVDVVE